MTAVTCASCGAALPFDAAFCPRCGAPSPAVRAAPAERDVTEQQIRERLARALGGKFEVRRLVCRGERADVFEVWDTSLGRRLAVKVLRPDVSWTPAMIAAFKEGTAVISRLNHPNILPVHFVDEGQGLVYYARPFVDGESLDTLVRRRGPLPISEALGIVNPLLQALEHAHREGVVHGGLKPANVMLDASGRPLLADFGIARLADCAPARESPAAATEYESPEQRHASSEGDARSDVYGAAALLVQVTTAGLAARGNPYEPPPPGGLSPGAAPIVDRLPKWLVTVLMRALARDPADRYESASALQAALASGAASSATELVPVEPLLRRLRGAEPVVLMPGAPSPPRDAPRRVSPPPVSPPRAEVRPEPVREIPPEPAAEPASRRPLSAPRRARAPVIPLLVLLLLLAGALVAWSLLTRPSLTVVNRLVLPVQVHVQNVADWTLEPGASERQTVARGRPVSIHWEVVQPMAGAVAAGERLGGSATIAEPGRASTYDVSMGRGNAAYFAPMITNETGAPLQIVVNAGLDSARACQCTVPPGARRMLIGYYRLFSNSTVEARDATGRSATFRNVGDQVTASSGTVGLRFAAGDLRLGAAPSARGGR